MTKHDASTRAPGADENRAGREALEQALQSVLAQLHDYLDDIVVIGGWVPHLYQRYGDFPHWRSKLSLTSEVDVLVQRGLPVATSGTVAQVLEKAGFQPTTGDAKAAVWINDPTRGEKVEFLVPNTGTLREQEGKVIPLPEQPGIGAIALSALDILERHTEKVTLPLRQNDTVRRAIMVRLPTLGAYVINKSATFNRRSAVTDDGANPKRAKDLLYLRDIMAGGDAVVKAVSAGIRNLVDSDAASRTIVDTAANHVELVSRGIPQSVSDVANILVERDGVSHAAATADIGGHLIDLAELLAEFRSPIAPHEFDWQSDA